MTKERNQQVEIDFNGKNEPGVWEWEEFCVALCGHGGDSSLMSPWPPRNSPCKCQSLGAERASIKLQTDSVAFSAADLLVVSRKSAPYPTRVILLGQDQDLSVVLCVMEATSLLCRKMGRALWETGAEDTGWVCTSICGLVKTPHWSSLSYKFNCFRCHI